MSKMNGPEYRLRINNKIILLDNRHFKLLKYIDECESITQASEEVNIPYRTALKHLEMMELELNEPLVSTQRGGYGGGGRSRLTNTGKLLLKEYKKVSNVLKLHTDVNEIESEIIELDQDRRIIIVYLNNERVILPLRGNFELGDTVLILINPEDIFITLKPKKHAVRNIFKGRITSMEFKNRLIRLNINLGKINLFTDVTEDLNEKLQLRIGKEVYIGFKGAATFVIKI